MFKILFKIMFISCILFSVLGCTQETDDKTVQMMALSRSLDMNSAEELIEKEYIKVNVKLIFTRLNKEIIFSEHDYKINICPVTNPDKNQYITTCMNAPDTDVTIYILNEEFGEDSIVYAGYDRTVDKVLTIKKDEFLINKNSSLIYQVIYENNHYSVITNQHTVFLNNHKYVQ